MKRLPEKMFYIYNRFALKRYYDNANIRKGMSITLEKTLTGKIVSIVIAFSSIILLVIDGILKPFLDKWPEVKLIIILLGVISAYHTLLTYVLKSQFSSIVKTLENELANLGKHINMLSKCTLPNDSIPYATLENIEKRHGLQSDAVKNEVWIIANNLQESNNSNGDDKTFLDLIYENLKRNVRYYYVLPDTSESRSQGESLCSQLQSLYFNESSLKSKRKESQMVKFNGGLFIGYEKDLEKRYPAEYFDIVIYIDCDANGRPIETYSEKKEGYYCFSKMRSDNAYVYSKMSEAKINELRHYYNQRSIFTKIDIIKESE